MGGHAQKLRWHSTWHIWHTVCRYDRNAPYGLYPQLHGWCTRTHSLAASIAAHGVFPCSRRARHMLVIVLYLSITLNPNVDPCGA